MLQHQGEDPTGKTRHPLSAALTLQQCLRRLRREGTTSRLTGAGSLLPPVYSEAWAKGNPRTPFSSLRDAAHGKHAGRKTNGVSQKQIKQHKSKDLKKYMKNKLNERNTRCKSKYVNKK
ncbi:hypothetical protein TNCV_2151141 [Trichonephila clavipes]|nr:hypothetical protein TNCV_2151141 [Trichonephila clavipes]